MDQVEYYDDRQLRRAAWKQMMRSAYLSGAGLLIGLAAVILSLFGIQKLAYAIRALTVFGGWSIQWTWPHLVSGLLCLGLVAAMVCWTIAGNRRNFRQLMAQPEGVRRLVVSRQMVRVFRQDGTQLVAVHWNRGIRLVRKNDLCFLYSGRWRCLAAFPLAAVGGLEGFARLYQTVTTCQDQAGPMTEVLWRGLISPRPGLVWGASYSLAKRWKGLQLRSSLLSALFAVVVLLAMFSFQVDPLLLTCIAVMVVILLAAPFLRAYRDRQASRAGNPVSLAELPARFELYEDGIQIARGEEGSFWSWERVDQTQQKRDLLALKQGRGIITLIPLDAFASEEECQRVTRFIQEHIQAAHPQTGRPEKSE